MINTDYNKNSNGVAMSLKLELVSSNPKTESNSKATSARRPKGLENAQTSFAKPKIEYTSSVLISQTLNEYSKKTPEELKGALNKFGVTESNYHEIQPAVEQALKSIEPQLVTFFGQDKGGGAQPSAFQHMLGNVNPFYLINEIMQKSGDNVSLSEISDMQSMNTAQSQFQNQIQGLQGEQTNIQNEEAKQSKHHILKDICSIVVAVVAVVAIVSLAATGVGAIADGFAAAGAAAVEVAGEETGEKVVGKAVEKGVKEAVEAGSEAAGEAGAEVVAETGVEVGSESSKGALDSIKKGLKKLLESVKSLGQDIGEIEVNSSEMGDGTEMRDMANPDHVRMGVENASRPVPSEALDSPVSFEGTDETPPKASESGLKKYLKSKKFTWALKSVVPALGVGITVGTGLNSYRTSRGNNKITQYQNTATMISTNMQNIQQQSQFQNSNMNNAQQQLSAFASVENAMFKAAAQTSQIQMV